MKKWELSDIQTGTIETIDPGSGTGFIVRDGDENKELIPFKLQDVLKDVGLGEAKEDRKVQFIQQVGPDSKPTAVSIVVFGN